MTAAHIPLPAYELSTEPLVTHVECEGRGEIETVSRWSGEAYGEPVTRRCTECRGTGEVEIDPRCPYCEQTVAADRCDDCATIYTTLTDLGNGRHGVAL